MQNLLTSRNSGVSNWQLRGQMHPEGIKCLNHKELFFFNCIRCQQLNIGKICSSVVQFSSFCGSTCRDLRTMFQTLPLRSSSLSMVRQQVQATCVYGACSGLYFFPLKVENCSLSFLSYNVGERKIDQKSFICFKAFVISGICLDPAGISLYVSLR